MAAVLRVGSVGIRGSETDTTRMAGPTGRESRARESDNGRSGAVAPPTDATAPVTATVPVTRSPLPVKAMPRQSKPGPRLEVDPGA